MMNIKGSLSLFEKLYEIPSRMTPEAKNIQVVGEFLNLSEQRKVAEAKDAVEEIFLLDIVGGIENLQEMKRGFPAHYLALVLQHMVTKNPEFLLWAEVWFRQNHRKISTTNYLLWGTFAFVYAKSTDPKRLSIILTDALGRKDKRLTALMETSQRTRIGTSRSDTLHRISVGKPIKELVPV